MTKKIMLMLNKRSLLVLFLSTAALAVVFFAFFWLWPDTQSKQLYEAAIMVTSQNNPNPAEDARTSLKAGDAVVIFPAGHPWSPTESASWLILKMDLTSEQAEKLMQPKTKTVKRDCPDGMPKDECKRYRNSEETVIARQYHVDITKLGIDIVEARDKGLLKDKVFGWDLIRKK